MSWLTGSAAQLGIVAAKAALIYLTAIFGLRLGERRTLAQWTLTDTAAAVAVGSIIGRTAVARTQSYVTGAIALITIILMHRLLSIARFDRRLSAVVGHRLRVLVADGKLRRRQLWWCGLTDDDLYAALRQRGHFDLARVRYVLFEAGGALTVVPEGPDPDSVLVRQGLDTAAGYQPSAGASPD